MTHNGIFPARPVIASFAKAMLFAELLLWAGLVAWLGAAGWSTPAALAVAVLLAALLRAGIIINTFTSSAALAARVDAGPLPFGARVRLLAAETWWTAVTFSALIPFPRLGGSMDSALPYSGATPPVLLVHGYLCNHGVWRAMKRFLESCGVGAWTHAAEPVFAGIDDYVPALAARIDAVLECTKAPRLVLVGHSMGGLILRAYLRAHGSRQVALCITLGTPHHGTRSARRGLGESARQMVPGSDWLKGLAHTESGGPPSPVVSIWSRHDNVVAPQESARLEEAENIALDGVGHMALVFSDVVQALVLEKTLGAARIVTTHAPG